MNHKSKNAEKIQELINLTGIDENIARELLEYNKYDLKKVYESMQLKEKLRSADTDDVSVLCSLLSCKTETAKKVLEQFGDVQAAESFLRQSLEFCRGDEDQVVYLL